jgi:DNA ligase-1
MIVTDEVLDCFENVAAAKGTNAKKVLLKEYLRNLYFATLLSYTFNPYRSFHVVKVPKVKKENRKPIEPREAWKLFILNADACSKREVTGNAAINLIHWTFQQCSEAQEKWMRKVLKKNLAIGVSTKTLNKVQPNFIPTFDVALAQKFDMKRIKSSEVFIEPKLDGIRCLAIVENREAKLFTRAGKLITNFDDTLGKELATLNDGCYDGEIMSKDFTELMRQVYRKDGKDISDVYFALFDYIPLKDWKAKQSQLQAWRRYEILACRLKLANAKYLTLVERQRVKSDYDEIKKIHDTYTNQGYEGAMIKSISAPYCFGRDWSVMKFKAFFDADVPIVGYKEGTGKHQNKLGSFLIDYKGVEVNVGSGLTDELREQLWQSPEEHIGRIIEVRYQEETPDGSLRFPTFVCFRNDKL